MTAVSNALGSFRAFCYKFCEQAYHIIDFAAEAIAIFLLVYLIIDFERK